MQLEPDVFLNTREAARYLGLSASLLNKLRVRGGGPVFVRLPGVRRVLYRSTDLLAWASAGRRRSTSVAGGQDHE